MRELLFWGSIVLIPYVYVGFALLLLARLLLRRPVRKAAITPGASLVSDYLAPRRAADQGFSSPHVIGEMLESHWAGRHDRSGNIWNLRCSACGTSDTRTCRSWQEPKLMLSVALIGPDGAGKTTVGRRLEHSLPLPVKYLYMGVNRDSSNRMLPTTRLIRAIKRLCGAKPDKAGPPDSRQAKERPKGLVKRAAFGVQSGLWLINQISEEWFRQGLAWHYQHRGHIVLFDRHYFSDYYAYDISPNGQQRPLTRRIHGFMLKHLYPKPELVIYLDAPAEVLFARKGEGTLELLERRRQEYLQMRGEVRHFAVVDASRPEEEVAQEVAKLISASYGAKAKNQTEKYDGGS